jgi:hypothetical protein
VYAEPNEINAYARAIVGLIDDIPRREQMGAIGRRRIVDQLAWVHQAPNYVGVYDRLLRPESQRSAATDASEAV